MSVRNSKLRLNRKRAKALRGSPQPYLDKLQEKVEQLGIQFVREYPVTMKLRKREGKGLKSYIIDLYLPSLHIALEADGGHHKDCPKQKWYDEQRDEHLGRKHIKVLRFDNGDITDDLDLKSVLAPYMEASSPWYRW